MSVRWELVIDCADPERQADFWAAALGYRRHGEIAQYRSIVDPDGAGPKLVFQQVPEARSGKNRFHIDVAAPDVDEGAARLEALGAARVREVAEFGIRWIVLTDPEGNELCVVPV